MCSLLKLVFIAFVICVVNANLVHRHEFNALRSRVVTRRESGCDKIVKETEWIQYGFDATELDFYKCPEIGGKRQQIFLLNDCSNGDQWKNKYINETLDVPNNLHVYEITSESNNFKTFTDFHAYADYLAADVGINHEQEHGLFSLSDDFQEIQKKLARNSLIIIQRKSVLYTIGYNPETTRLKLHENFTEFAESLPKSFKFNPPKFIEFIKTFGTHFVSNAGFGGMVRRLKFIDNSKWKKSATHDMILKAQKGFPYLSSSEEELCKDTKFNLTYKYSGNDYEQQYFGISPDELKEVGFEKWKSVVSKTPHIVSLELQPISKILNGDLALEIEKAVKAYMAKAYLDESVRKLKIQLSIGLPKTNYTDDYLEQYEMINKTNNYELQEIRDLTSKIRYEARQPVPVVSEVDGSNCIQLNSFIKYSLFIFVFLKFVAFP